MCLSVCVCARAFVRSCVSVGISFGVNTRAIRDYMCRCVCVCVYARGRVCVGDGVCVVCVYVKCVCVCVVTTSLK